MNGLAGYRIGAEDAASGNYAGQSVRAVGKLVSFDGNTAQLQLAGEGPTLAVSGAGLQEKLAVGGGDVPTGRCYFEAIGMLQAGGLTQHAVTYMGDNFDIDMYKQMLALTKQVPDLFHGH